MFLLVLSHLSSDLLETPLILILKTTMQVGSKDMDLTRCFTFLSSFFFFYSVHAMAMYFTIKCVLQIYVILRDPRSLTIMARLQPTFIDCKKLDLEERKCQEIKRRARGRKY